MIVSPVFAWVLVAALFAIVINIVLAIRVAITGLRAKKYTESIVTVIKHKRMVKIFYASFIPPVCLIEIAVLIKGGSRDQVLFSVHTMFITSFLLISIAMYFVWTGRQNKNIHRPLSRFLLSTYLGVTGTGILLTLDALK